MYNQESSPTVSNCAFSGNTAALGGGAGACLGCSGAPWAEACPNGIPIARYTRDAASRLAWPRSNAA